jgi:hypothetical protein
MSNQLNELRKGENTSNNSNRYNLQSKKKEGNPDTHEWPARVEKPTRDIEDNNK